MKIIRYFLLSVLLCVSGAFYFYQSNLNPFIKPQTLVTKQYEPFISPARYNRKYVENENGQHKHNFRANGVLREYNVYMPENLGGGLHPAVFLFHGGQRTGASMIERWKSLADKKKFIIIAPHGLRGMWNEHNDATYLIPALIKAASSKYPIDQNYMFMFGHSAGGNLVNYSSILYPDLFKGAAIHAGAIHETRLPKEAAAHKMPIIYINGTNDALFSVSHVTESAQAMATRGHYTELILITNHTHWYYDLAPQINAIAWEFFEKKIFKP